MTMANENLNYATKEIDIATQREIFGKKRELVDEVSFQ